MFFSIAVNPEEMVSKEAWVKLCWVRNLNKNLTNSQIELSGSDSVSISSNELLPPIAE